MSGAKEEGSLGLGSYTHMMNSELYPHKEKIVDDDCLEDAEPFELLSGESIEFLGKLGPLDGDHLAITNFRFFAGLKSGFYSVPLGLIESAEIQHTKEELLVLCKDARAFRLVFDSASKCKLWQERLGESVKQVACGGVRGTFAFIHRAYQKDERREKEGEGKEEPRDSQNGVLPTGRKQDKTSRNVLAILDLVTREFQRMGMGGDKKKRDEGTGVKGNKGWHIAECNSKYKLCPTYPKLLVLPRAISEDKLHKAAKFRMSGRIPVVVWRHQANGSVIVRSSQPLVGVFGWRSSEDEELLKAISEACTHQPSQTESDHHQYHNGVVPQQGVGNGGYLLANGALGNGGPVQNGGTFTQPEGERALIRKLIVMDLRSYTAALGNRAKGGGCECQDYYPNCEIEYKGLPNIHSVRKSFQQLRTVLTSDDQSNFLSNLENTQWLSYLCQLLSVACEVVTAINDQGLPVLVHCSDGWDRTTQVVTLAELMLDPFYRTIEGFQVLIEREWLSYGHKFSDRCGHTSDDPNQRSPVFLQWLDCVHQLTRQFPCDFQFNDAFLIKLAQHCYSGLFGTFLGNNVREREEERVAEETSSLWALLHTSNRDFSNYLYSPTNKVLRAVPHIRNMLLWREMYCSPLLIPYSSEEEEEEEEEGERDSPEPLLPRSPLPQSAPNPAEERTAALNSDCQSRLAVRTPSSEEQCKKQERLVSSAPAPDQESSEQCADQDGQAPCASPLDQQRPGDLKNLLQPAECAENGDHNHKNSDEEGSLYQSMEDTGVKPTQCPTESLMGAHTNTSPDFPSLDRKLLQDAICDDLETNLPRAAELEAISQSRTTVCSSASVSLSLGADGLPPMHDVVHLRLREMESQYQLQLEDLQKQLEEAKLAVCEHKVEESVEGEGEMRVEGSPHKEAGSPVEQQSSLGSWDRVGVEDSQGVRWVPDHAANHCQSCGTKFWVGLRKHHCRNCGDVFCYDCSKFYCPVPTEQLYGDVRVCEKCYYKLDGHLRKSKFTSPT